MSRLTKKHFEALATASHYRDASYFLCCDIADVLAETNPLFDKARFLNKAVTESAYERAHVEKDEKIWGVSLS